MTEPTKKDNGNLDDNLTITLKDKCLYVVAKRNSGKSVLIKYLVSKQKHLFDKIILICPSECLNGDYTRDGLINPKYVYEQYDESFINKLIEKMTAVNEGKSKTDKDFKRVLLILDDAMADTKFHLSPSFKKLLARSRHFGCSLIFSSQSINGFPPLARSNADTVLISQLNNASLEIAGDEFSNGISKNEFKSLYKENTKDYNFLVINQCQTQDNSINQTYGQIKAPII